MLCVGGGKKGKEGGGGGGVLDREGKGEGKRKYGFDEQSAGEGGDVLTDLFTHTYTL